jgi:hypothetical protein
MNASITVMMRQHILISNDAFGAICYGSQGGFGLLDG